MDDDKVSPHDGLFAALGDPDRMAIVQHILEKESTGRAGVSITEIAQLAGLDRFSASRHLAVLRASGILRVEPWRTSKLHAVRLEAFLQLEDWLVPIIGLLEARDSARCEESV